MPEAISFNDFVSALKKLKAMSERSFVLNEKISCGGTADLIARVEREGVRIKVLFYTIESPIFLRVRLLSKPNN